MTKRKKYEIQDIYHRSSKIRINSEDDVKLAISSNNRELKESLTRVSNLLEKKRKEISKQTLKDPYHTASFSFQNSK